jgi:hypothetical protein
MILSYWAFGESRDSLESIEEWSNLSIDFGAITALCVVGLSQLATLKTSIGDSGKSHPMLVSKFSGVLFGTQSRTAWLHRACHVFWQKTALVQ